MKRGIIWIVLTCLIVTSLVLASCAKSTTTSTSTSTTTTTTTNTTTQTTTTTTTTTPTTTPTTTTATGNWWDSLGTPQYGGTLVIPMTKDPTVWDPYLGTTNPSMCAIWMEQPTANDWTLNPSIYDYTNGYTPPDYCVRLPGIKLGVYGPHYLCSSYPHRCPLSEYTTGKWPFADCGRCRVSL